MMDSGAGNQQKNIFYFSDISFVRPNACFPRRYEDCHLFARKYRKERKFLKKSEKYFCAFCRLGN